MQAMPQGHRRQWARMDMRTALQNPRFHLGHGTSTGTPMGPDGHSHIQQKAQGAMVEEHQQTAAPSSPVAHTDRRRMSDSTLQYHTMAHFRTRAHILPGPHKLDSMQHIPRTRPKNSGNNVAGHAQGTTETHRQPSDAMVLPLH